MDPRAEQLGQRLEQRIERLEQKLTRLEIKQEFAGMRTLLWVTLILAAINFGLMVIIAAR